MEKLTTFERAALRKLNVNYSDLHIAGANSMGIVYGLYNDYFLTEMTCNGYTKREVYRILARKLLRQCGIE